MKKLLGISVIAALAVLPMAGYAAVGEPVAGDPGATVTENAQMATNSPKYALATEHGTDGNLATAGYVKGAYNAAIKAVNKLSDDTDTKVGTLSNLDTTAKTNLVAAINEVRTAASNGSGAIETKLAAGASGYDINAKSAKVQGVDVVTVSGTQTLTNKTIDADDNTISNLETDNLKDGTLVTSVAGEGDGIAAVAQASDTKLVSEKAVAEAIAAAASDASDDADAIETNLTKGAGGYDLNVNSAQVQGVNVVTVSGTQTLTNKTISGGTVSGATITGGSIDADSTTISNLETDNLKEGVLVNSTTGIAAASSASDTKLVSEKAVRNAIDSVSTTMGSDYAKKTGVTQTITNSTISGTVPVMATWDNTTATTVAIAASITGATYAEPTTPAPAPEPAGD